MNFLFLFFLFASTFALPETFKKYKTELEGNMEAYGQNYNLTGEILVNHEIGKGIFVEAVESDHMYSKIGAYCIDEKKPDYMCVNSKGSSYPKGLCVCQIQPSALDSIDMLDLLNKGISEDLGEVDCPKECGKVGRCKKYITDMKSPVKVQVEYYVTKDEGHPLCINSFEINDLHMRFVDFTTSFSDEEFKYPFDPETCDQK